LQTVQSPNLGFNSTTNRYIIGPTAELRLPFGLGFELDALYRHYNLQATGTAVAGGASTGAWEFPLLAKYRFPSAVVRPYVDGGIAWDRLVGFQQFATSVAQGAPQIRHDTTTGYVVGAGLDVHALFLHLSPEIRYTRWGAQHFLDPNGGFSSNQNQAEFLLGITF
ncbi:MAG: PorT family protein, partial [Methanomicrobiales archaeon]|nr:PorT family protein [Methanomicrobiales archaeon]